VLGGFLFSGDDVFKKVTVLSGGEKTRLVLCKIMMSAPNVLLMDEPTNHLDIPGRQMLEDALESYEGTMVLISHDRHFINQLCNKIGVIEEGQLITHPGNFDDYQRLWISNPDSALSQNSPSPLADRLHPHASTREAPRQASPEIGASHQNDKRSQADERKKQAANKKPLEKKLVETERRLGEIAERSRELENDLSDGSIYRDGDKVKSLKLELGNLYAEKTKLEEIWNNTVTELES
ncbi:MAG: ATP-binding cassette domain-containing protein, partial [Deltaproteobacteria bacterium]|nr:ATP-binding cassette domain-containing protein [Deltaproteobacteria bacterium]